MAEIDLDDLSTPDHGYTVNDQDDDDPVLLDRDGNRVETWRERYPYDHRMPRDEYERLKRRLQIELLKLQNYSKRTGARHVIVFEGGDAAGKGGTIRRFMEHLNPRSARVVALEKPSERERTQGDFQRPINPPPAPRAGTAVVRPIVVQPRGRGEGDGLLHARAVRRIHGPGASFRADAGRRRDKPDQVLVLRVARRAANPVRDPPGRPGAAVEVFPDGHRVGEKVGRLHRGEGGDVRSNRYRRRAVDRGQE